MRSLLLVFSIILFTKAYGQEDEFCSAVNTIIRDAPNKFRNIKGDVVGDNPNATMWACGIQVPGVIGSRFVSSMGLFYEGAFFQTKNKEALNDAYNKYKSLLAGCLEQQHYKLSTQPNFYPGMSDYKKVVFMPVVDSNATLSTAPSHVTLEATFSKDVKLYTVVMYIFEH
jgi:hypothetical protein